MRQVVSLHAIDGNAEQTLYHRTGNYNKKIRGEVWLTMLTIEPNSSENAAIDLTAILLPLVLCVVTATLAVLDPQKKRKQESARAWIRITLVLFCGHCHFWLFSVDKSKNRNECRGHGSARAALTNKRVPATYPRLQ